MTPSGGPVAAGSAPLADVVVIDLGRIIAGPFCSFVLASLGATVVRVEPLRGDVSWGTPPFIGPDGSVSTSARTSDEISLSHLKRGRGKRSVALDYSSEDGHAVLLQLLDRADVVVENFRPAVLEPLGLDYPTLAERNPRLVYCAISGYGLSGPNRDWPAMDVAIQAASGLMARTGFAEGPPIKTGATLGDQIPAVYGALGVVAALRQRDVTGRGQLVDVAMNDVMTSLLWDDPIDQWAQQGLPDRWGNADPRGGPLNVYRAAEGWVALVVSSDAHWAVLCRTMDREDLLEEGRTLADRRNNAAHIDEMVAQWCTTKPAVQLAEELRAAGIPGAAVASPRDALTDPQSVHRRTLRPLVHPDSPGTESGFAGTALPVHLGGYDPPLEPAETLGTSTREILSEMLGMSAQELDDLAAKGTI